MNEHRHCLCKMMSLQQKDLRVKSQEGKVVQPCKVIGP